MNRIMTGCVVGALAVALASPSVSHAGQREWATAGKILTGVVAAGVIANAFFAPPARAEVRFVERPVYDCRPVVRSYPPRNWGYRPMPAPVYCRPACPPPVVCEPVAPVCAAPIIVDLGSGRRLYQPPVHGCKSFIQVWSSVNQEWVSIEERPSIW
jgi:hypothetical protein